MIGVDMNSLLYETRDLLDKVRRRLDDAFAAMTKSWEESPVTPGLRRVWEVQLTCGHSQHYYSKPVMGDRTWCSKCPGVPLGMLDSNSAKSWVRSISDESQPNYWQHAADPTPRSSHYKAPPKIYTACTLTCGHPYMHRAPIIAVGSAVRCFICSAPRQVSTIHSVGNQS